MKYLVFGYRHHKRDSDFEGYRIFSKKWYERWADRLYEEIELLNSKEDTKHPIIVTFVTKL